MVQKIFRKIDFVERANLSISTPTTIKFGESFEFTVTWKSNAYFVENVKGDFDITNITAVSAISAPADSSDNSVHFNKLVKTFYSTVLSNGIYTFYITANIEMIKILAFTYQIQIPLNRLKLLEVNQYFQDEFVSPKYPDFKVKYYVKKIGSEGKNIEIHIESLYDYKIQGEKGDYKSVHSGDEDINLELSFVCVFDNHDPFPECAESLDANIGQTTLAEESRPESVIPTLPDNQFYDNLYKIMTNEKNADAFLIASNETKIHSNRCVLAEFSPIFASIMEDRESPITITVEDFDAETIKAAMDFLYKKRDSIVGKEEKVFKFAVKYRIQTIMEACRSYFEKSVNPSNVCEYIQIAYSNDFEELKQKCLKLLIANKNEIGAAKIADLPKNILRDFLKF